MNHAILTLSLLSQAAATAPEPAPPEIASLVRVDLAERPDLGLAWLLEQGFDVAFTLPDGTGFELVAGPADRARLAELGLSVEVLHEDLTAFYAGRLQAEGARGTPALGAWLTPPFGQGEIGGYYSWAQVVSVLDQISAAYPAITTDKLGIGQSIEGRDLWALKLSDNPDVDEGEPEVRFDAMHHAREPESMQALLWSLLWFVESYGTDPLATWIVDHREIWFLPVVNPDGYVYNQSIAPSGGGLWRKNRRNLGGGQFGVDLNRNYPFGWGADDVGSSPFFSSETYRGAGPASEPEIAAMVAFFAARDFVTSLSCHTYSNLHLYPWGYVASTPPDDARFEELSILATEDNHYVYGPAGIVLYLANGTTNDHEYSQHGTFSWTPEIGGDGDGFWPPTDRIVPLAEENLTSFVRTALAAGAYVHATELTLTEVGDGDGFVEAGETVELRVFARNSGRAATSGSVQVGLSTASPDVSVGTASASLGGLGSFADGDNDASPLTFTVLPGTPIGTAIPYEVSVDWEGYAETLSGQLVIGRPRVFLTDDVELDLGWQAGLPSDTATTGLWAFGNPVGTFSGSDPLNPEDDATPGAGVDCFTTGNGSTSSGGDDVDNGITTLITPRLDLSEIGPAVLSYQRWYANFGSPADDVFEVSISEDGGSSWLPLETVAGPENSWTPRSFLVLDHVDQTDDVRVRFVASDDPNNSLTEAAVDELRVEVYQEGPLLGVYGRPALGDPLALHVASDPGDVFLVYASLATASYDLPFVSGTLHVLPPLFLLTSGLVPASELSRTFLPLPTDPTLLGIDLHLQALLVGPGSALCASNHRAITLE